jgi:hypothetical protein
MRSIIQCTLLLALSLTATAADAETSLTGTTGVRSQYVSGFGALLHDKPVLQTDLFLTLPQGFWVDAWGSTDFHGGKNFGRELNIGAGKTWKHLDVGAYYYDLTPQFSTKDGDIVHAHAEAGVDIFRTKDHTLRPSLRGEYFYVTLLPSENSGYLGKFALTETYAIFDWLTVIQSPKLVRAEHIFGNPSATLLDYELKVRWNPSALSFTASGRAIGPLHNVPIPPQYALGLDAAYTWDIAKKE